MRATGTVLSLSFALAAAACGKTHALADAGTTDGDNTDAASAIDASPYGPVTVTVLSQDGQGTPVVGADVVFIEPDGTVAKEAKTDASGKATADVLPGASVTAIYAAPPNTSLETVLGVKPGDDLTIGSKRGGTDLGNFTANVFQVLAGTTNYYVYGPCGYGSTPGLPPAGTAATVPVTLSVASDCKTDPMELVAVREDNGTATDYAGLPSASFTVDGTVTQVDAWKPMEPLAFTYTNLSTNDVTFINGNARVPDSFGYNDGNSVQVTTDTATFTVNMPHASHTLFYTGLRGPHAGDQSIYESVAGTPATYTLDVDAAQLPWLGTPVLDPATAKIAIPLTGGHGTGDAMEVNVEFRRPDPGGGSGAQLIYDWHVWTSSAGDVQLPTLPANLASNNPTSTDDVPSWLTQAWLYDADAVTSYDQIRAQLYSAMNAYYAGRGTTGRLRVSVSPNNNTFR